MNKKQQIITALRAFVAQRSGMDWRNYADATSYRAEQRSITRDGKEARELIRAIEWRDSITADMIIDASKLAFSGRLSIVERENDSIAVDYTTGQYFPTEYRKAVCALCAKLLYDCKRDDYVAGFEESAKRPITWMELRAAFVREYGHGIVNRWFHSHVIHMSSRRVL